MLVGAKKTFLTLDTNRLVLLFNKEVASELIFGSRSSAKELSLTLDIYRGRIKLGSRILILTTSELT
ncbi:unnamed protein product [Rhizophagus irregularis]|nr:unnamed protein product [Rhizophagus irregularis]